MRFVIALFLLTSIATAQDDFDRLERVPPEFLQHGRLIDKAQGFTIDAPRGWSWYRPRDDTSKYMALSSSGAENFTVHVSSHYGDTITREDVNLILFDMGQRLAGDQGSITNQIVREIDYPKPNSWFGTFSVTSSTGSVAYFIYLVKSERLFTLQAVTMDGFMPTAFKPFLMSLNVQPDIFDPAEEEPTSVVLSASPTKATLGEGATRSQREKGTFIVTAFLALLALIAGFTIWKRQHKFNQVSPPLVPQPNQKDRMEDLRQEVRETPDNMALWRSYWDRALAEGNKDDLAIAGRRLLEEALKQGSTEGLYFWEQMVAQLGGDKLSLVLHNKLARLLLARAQPEAAVKVLRTCVQNQGKQPFSQRMQTFELALTCDLELASNLFDPLIHSVEKTERDKQRLMEVQPKLKGQPDPSSQTAPSDPGKNLLVQEVGLTRLDASGLELLIGQQTKRLPYHQVKSLAVGVLKKSEHEQLLVFDLALDDVRQDLPRYRILRFTSAQLAITSLLPQAATAKEGYILLARHILEQSGSLPLPSLASALGKYIRVNSETSWRAKMYP